MDRLDTISILVIILLLIGSFTLIERHKGEAKTDRNLRQEIPAQNNPIAAGEQDSAGKVIKNLMEAGSLAKAEILSRELIQKYPYQGEPHILMGDLFMRKQEAVKAMHEYKEALDLNPDYLDKKTPLFQGKKLKVAVGEALAEIEKQLKADPENESLKSEKKIIYYLYRKIAGSCG